MEKNVGGQDRWSRLLTGSSLIAAGFKRRGFEQVGGHRIGKRFSEHSVDSKMFSEQTVGCQYL